jgi:predicted transcriptional regulator
MKKQSLISAFDSLLGPPIADEIPEGFYTSNQIAEHQNISIGEANKKLSKLFKDGRVERRQFRNSIGRVCWFYRVK